MSDRAAKRRYGKLPRQADKLADASLVPTRLPVGRAQTARRPHGYVPRLLLAVVLVVSGGLFVAHIQQAPVVPSPARPLAPAPGPCPGAATCLPYSPDSPWDTPIGPNPVVRPDSAAMIATLNGTGLPLTADPDQYTIPVYYFDDSTPRRSVHLSGYFSSYDGGDGSRVGHGYAPTISGVPVPPQAHQSSGTDGQIEIGTRPLVRSTASGSGARIRPERSVLPTVTATTRTWATRGGSLRLVRRGAGTRTLRDSCAGGRSTAAN